METRPVALSLPSGDGFGWGVCGDHLRSSISNHVEIPTSGDYPTVFDIPMIHGIQGVNMLPFNLNQWSRVKNIGLCFIEESERLKLYVDNAKRYFDHVCGGSTWNAAILRDAGLLNVSAAIQGVDTNLFTGCNPRSDDGRFVIFSGGKMEWRKGTDIAMKAASIMMQRHADVYLMASWFNPWRASLNTMADSPLFRWEGSIDRAIDDFGIDRARLLGPVGVPVRNRDMPLLYSQCDVGLFPNRVEGGTNMVMCEFMACAKSVIAMKEHGHADVVRSNSHFALHGNTKRTSPVATYWEPSLEDILEALEFAYTRPRVLVEEGEDNRKWIETFTWAACAESLLEACV